MLRKAILQHGVKSAASRRAIFAGARTLSTRPEPQHADSLMQIGTRDIFDADADMYRTMCRAFFENEVVPFHSEWEKAGEVSREVWQSAGKNGILGVTMPSEYGGSECDIGYAAIGWEEQSYSNCTGPGFSLHSEIVMPYILHYGTDEQKDKYLPALISGEKISAIAMTEPGAGSDLQGMKTFAKKDGDDWILNGVRPTSPTDGYQILSSFAHRRILIAAARMVSLSFLSMPTRQGFKRARSSINLE